MIGEIIVNPPPTTQDNGLDDFSTTGWSGFVHVVEFTNLTPGSQIDAVAINVVNPAGSVRYKVYQDDGPGGDPSTLLGESNSISAQAGTIFNSLNSPAIIPPSGNVWVGFETDSSTFSAFYGTDTKKYIARSYGVGPDPFGPASTNTFALWAGIEISGAAPPPPSTVPDAPTALTATAVSPSQIDLSWIAPLDDGGEPITDYQIEVMVGAGPWSILVANAGTSLSYSDLGLVEDTTYTYRVSAINSVGTSVPSNEASDTTPTSQPSGVPSPSVSTLSSPP